MLTVLETVLMEPPDEGPYDRLSAGPWALARFDQRH
jgi:hypothetical protein